MSTTPGGGSDSKSSEPKFFEYEAPKDDTYRNFE